MSLFEELNSINAEDAKIDPYDYSHAPNILNAPSWRASLPEKRGELVERGMSTIMSSLEKDYAKQVPYITPSGERVMKPAWTAAKTATKEQYDYLDRSRKMLNDAARDPNGGLDIDEYGATNPASWTKNYFNQASEKQPEILPDYDKWFKDRDILADSNEEIIWKDYVEFANAEVGSDEAKIDVNNQWLKKAWEMKTRQSTFDPSTMGEDEVIREVGGSYVINPNLYFEIDKVEGAIESLEISSAQKKMLLLGWKENLEKFGGGNQ
jgi:hypothetical protein